MQKERGLWCLNDQDLIHILQKRVFFLWRSNRGCFPLTVPLLCELLERLRVHLALVYNFATMWLTYDISILKGRI